MGVIYFVFMMIGAFAYRVSPAGWRPEAGLRRARKKTMISEHHVHLTTRTRRRSSGYRWVLCLNVSAGIGVIGMAVPMLPGDFRRQSDRSARREVQCTSAEQKVAIATIAAGFGGLLSLFNIGGRFFWASAVRLYRPQEQPITHSSFWALRSMHWHRPSQRWARNCFSSGRSLSSCRCMAAASPPDR